MKFQKSIVIIFIIVLTIINTFIPATLEIEAKQTNEIFLTTDNSLGAETGDYQGKKSVLLVQGSRVSWRFDAANDTQVNLSINYCPLPGDSSDIELRFYLDGKLISENIEGCIIPRFWQEKRGFKEKRYETDNRGNEITPYMQEHFFYFDYILTEKQGTDKPLEINLKAGSHTLEIEAVRQGAAIYEVRLFNELKLISYSEYFDKYKALGAKDAPKDAGVSLEAELADVRSDSAIYPVYDKSTPDVSPSSPSKIYLNTIGGGRWSKAGKWISWNFSVPADGYYTISFKYLQNSVRDLEVFRKIEIDGKVPFKELNSVGFLYGLSWQNKTLGINDTKPYKIYLTAGEHNLRLTAVLGTRQDTVKNLEDAVRRLNKWYRYIVMVTGTQPDRYRDYYLDAELPDLIANFKEIREILNSENTKLIAVTGKSGGHASFIEEVIRQLTDFIEDSRTIPERLDRFKGNIGSLAELISELKEQPLQLDTITVRSSAEDKPESQKASLFRNIIFRASAFLSSFTQDYSMLGDSYSNTEKPIKVWVSVNDMLTSGIASGRDQAQTIKRLIDEKFTKQTGIAVNLSLVNTTEVLTQAIMGGKGPDAALFLPESVPINLAVRGALTELSSLEGFKEIQQGIEPHAFIAYQYSGGVYAIPETQVFPMMFIRTDVFDELGLQLPNTWDDMYSVISKLQKKNMQVGIPESQSVFEMLLLQNGANLFNEDMTKTTLTQAEAQSAFKTWTDLYLQYDLDVALNFFNRFRTGEMPVGITDFTMYNQLSVAAPEIQGLWKMYPVPGTKKDDEIIRTVSCNGSACVILSDSKLKEQSWSFIRWWTQTDIQNTFSAEMESVLGTAARYNSANKVTFLKLPWSEQERVALEQQRRYVSDIPLSPANYYITRNLTNAFRQVVYYYKNPNEVLDRYAKDIDEELIRKLQELSDSY